MSKKSAPKSLLTYLIWPVAVLALLFVFRAVWGGSGKDIGEKIYQNNCASCHGKSGEGFGELVPPLANADFVQQYPEQLPCIIMHGINGPIRVNGKTYDQPMAGIGFDELGLPRLSPSQIQLLINFIQSSWGNDLAPVSRQQVNDWLQTCEIPDL